VFKRLSNNILRNIALFNLFQFFSVYSVICSENTPVYNRVTQDLIARLRHGGRSGFTFDLTQSLWPTKAAQTFTARSYATGVLMLERSYIFICLAMSLIGIHANQLNPSWRTWKRNLYFL